MINRIAYENLENDEHALDQESGKIDDVSDNSNNTKKDSLEFETAGSMKKRKIQPSLMKKRMSTQRMSLESMFVIIVRRDTAKGGRHWSRVHSTINTFLTMCVQMWTQRM